MRDTNAEFLHEVIYIHFHCDFYVFTLSVKLVMRISSKQIARKLDTQILLPVVKLLIITAYKNGWTKANQLLKKVTYINNLNFSGLLQKISLGRIDQQNKKKLRKNPIFFLWACKVNQWTWAIPPKPLLNVVSEGN